MTASFNPSAVVIPVGHFIGGFVELPGDDIPVLRPLRSPAHQRP